MKKLIKRISLFLAAFSVLALASACGLGESDASSSSVKESSNGATSSAGVSEDSSAESEEETLYSDGAELEWDWFE